MKKFKIAGGLESPEGITNVTGRQEISLNDVPMGYLHMMEDGTETVVAMGFDPEIQAVLDEWYLEEKTAKQLQKAADKAEEKVKKDSRVDRELLLIAAAKAELLKP